MTGGESEGSPQAWVALREESGGLGGKHNNQKTGSSAAHAQRMGYVEQWRERGGGESAGMQLETARLLCLVTPPGALLPLGGTQA